MAKFVLFVILLSYYFYGEDAFNEGEGKNKIRYSLIKRMPKLNYFCKALLKLVMLLYALIYFVRMDRRCFSRSCKLLQIHGGLQSSKNISIQEQVAIFLNVITHHTKMRVISFQYKRSYYTISKCIKNVLRAIMIVHRYMLVTPEVVEEGFFLSFFLIFYKIYIILYKLKQYI